MVYLPIKVVVASPRPLDCKAISLVIDAHHGMRVLASDAILAAALEACREYRSDILLIGPGFREERTIGHAGDWLQNGPLKLIAFLDDAYAVGRAIRIMQIGGCCYLTRNQTLDSIFDALLSDLTFIEDRSARGVAPAPSLSRHRPALQEQDHFGVGRLSRREREVMSALASGCTVKETATRLGLADSTVDNHKARFMKKLNIHKAADVVRIALASGLVDPLWEPRNVAPCSQKQSARARCAKDPLPQACVPESDAAAIDKLTETN